MEQARIINRIGDELATDERLTLTDAQRAGIDYGNYPATLSGGWSLVSVEYDEQQTADIATYQRDNPYADAIQQFRRFKEQYPDCVLFFRMGDFYEMFYDDARLAHKVLGVTLTQRTAGIPMAGVPYHAVEGYLRRMIQAGHRVAIVEPTTN